MKINFQTFVKEMGVLNFTEKFSEMRNFVDRIEPWP
jgi:hypothetical protein